MRTLSCSSTTTLTHKAIQQLVEHSQELERTLAALQEKLSRLEKSEREQLRAVK